jgi:serine/threonine protein kinase
MTETTALLSIGQYSDTGIKDENQDSFGVLLPDGAALNHKGIVAVIADGVSGCDEGKLASETCVKSLLMDYYCTPDSWTVKTSIQKVLLATNRWMYGLGAANQMRHKGVATTLSALVVKSSTAHLFHIGDTRIYLLRKGELTQLTKDHRVWVSEDNNYLTRAMGVDLHLDIDYRSFLLEKNDIFLMTTDGVHEFISDAKMSEFILQNTNNLDRAAREISTLALQNGSSDNVTCQIIKFNQLPQVDETEVYRKLTELPFPPELNSGMLLDGFRIQRELYASKRTQVYLATDEASGDNVVIKTPSVNYADDASYLDMFMLEEWVGKLLNNNHVLKIVEQTRPRQFLYYVTEYIEGQTLRQWMNDNTAPSLQEVREIVNQLARGLRAFHRKEMIHQDLKPENVIIDTHGTIKIIDFGSTRIAGVEEISTPIERLSLLGTQYYTAPEHFTGLPSSHQSDAFSLGVLTYEMLTGHLPYGEKYGEKALNKLTYVSARQHNEDVPTWVDGALKKVLAKNSQHRYEEISEFLHDLAKPNKDFIETAHVPLVESNPLGFWKGVAIISLLANIALLFYK